MRNQNICVWSYFWMYFDLYTISLLLLLLLGCW